MAHQETQQQTGTTLEKTLAVVLFTLHLPSSPRRDDLGSPDDPQSLLKAVSLFLVWFLEDVILVASHIHE